VKTHAFARDMAVKTGGRSFRCADEFGVIVASACDRAVSGVKHAFRMR
jgi:hypothetical protein